MFLQGSTTVPVTAAASKASSVGDAGSTRLVYFIVVLLVLLGGSLAYFAYAYWRRTRPDASGPGEQDQQSPRRDPYSSRNPYPEQLAPRAPQQRREPAPAAGGAWWDQHESDGRPATRAPQQSPQSGAQRPRQQPPSTPRDPLL